VVKNLNVVLDTAVRHRQTFDETVDNFDKLVKGLNANNTTLANGTAEFGNAAGNLADLLADNRKQLHSLFPPAGPEPPDRMADVESTLE
jgi:phospholipid/cholesterol/gamma-HCH transport system substrate-binding protein